MNTIERDIISPFQVGDISAKNHVLQQEIKKHVGICNFTAEFKEDTQMIERLKISGLVAFTCEIKRDGKVIAYGRGSSVLNRINKWPERSVRYARDSALLDGVLQANRVLDEFNLENNQEISITPNNACKASNTDHATEKQRKFLSVLVEKIGNVEEREREKSQIDSLSRSEASEKINQLLCGI